MIGSQNPQSVSSCSPLYLRMRNAVVSRPVSNGNGGNSGYGQSGSSSSSSIPLTELQRRLQNLSNSITKGTQPHLPANLPTSQALSHMANPASYGNTGYNNNNNNDSPAGASGNTVQPQYMAQAEADEEAIRAQDLFPVRVIELEDSVELRANTDIKYTSTEGRPPNMELVCADARVKIFTKHVVAARADSGAPVAELVLEELFQLSEDEDTHSLLFFLGPKPAGDGKSIAATTIVEFRCQNVEQLRCLYKMVSIRRSGVEILKQRGQ